LCQTRRPPIRYWYATANITSPQSKPLTEKFPNKIEAYAALLKNKSMTPIEEGEKHDQE
jgi:hypothetical protein